MFPKKKFKVTFLSLCAILMLLKWSVDVCLPNIEGSQVFPVALAAPELICEPLKDWDLTSRSKTAKSQSLRNFYNPAPTVFDTDEGKQSLFLFSKDVFKLTVLLSRVPREPQPLLQLFVVTFILAIILAILWEVVENVVLTPVEYVADDSTPRNPLLEQSPASRTILPSYLTQRSSRRSGGPRSSVFQKPPTEEDK